MKTLTELNLTEEQAQKFIQKNTCGECGNRLNVAWGGSFGFQEYVIRCSNSSHSQFGKVKSDKEIIEEKLMNESLGAQVGSKALAKVPVAIQPLMNKLVLSQQEAITILRTLWLEAPDIEIKKAAAICAMYRLNPLMKHLFLIPYEKKDKDGNVVSTSWSCVLGISATRLMASRKHKYSFMDGPRLMSEKEQLTTFGEYNPNILVVLVRLKNEAGMEAPGYGSWPKTITYYDRYKKQDVTKINEPKGTEKGNTMFNQAAIRAERQAFARLCPQDLPGQEIEVVDEQYQELPAGKVIEGEVIIDQETGEIKEQQGQKEETPDKAFEAMKSQTEGKQTKYPADWKPGNVGELMQYALDEKGLSKGMVLADVLCIGNVKDINLERDFERVKATKKFEAKQ